MFFCIRVRRIKHRNWYWYEKSARKIGVFEAGVLGVISCSGGDDLRGGRMLLRRWCWSCYGGGVRFEFTEQLGEVGRVLVDPKHLAARTFDDRHAPVPEAPLAGPASGCRGLVDAGG